MSASKLLTAPIPLQNGLYAAAAGAILYAVFGTSRPVREADGGSACVGGNGGRDD